jgi:hypothetical protein
VESRVVRPVLIGLVCGVAGAYVWRYLFAPTRHVREPAIEQQPLEELTVEQLRRIARQLEIPGRSTMRKQQLIDAIANT